MVNNSYCLAFIEKIPGNNGGQMRERERERQNWNSEKWGDGAAAFPEAMFYNPIYASYRLFI